MHTILFCIGGTLFNLGKDPNVISNIKSSERPEACEIAQDSQIKGKKTFSSTDNTSNTKSVGIFPTPANSPILWTPTGYPTIQL